MLATIKNVIFIIFIGFQISDTKIKTFKRLQHNPKKEELCNDEYNRRNTDKKEFSVAPIKIKISKKNIPKMNSNINSSTIGKFKSLEITQHLFDAIELF